MSADALVSAEVDIQVPFHDLDPLEVVWHGHHVKYFEVARCALFDRIGYNFPQMKESGYVWPVIELFVRYAHPLRFGQIIRVRADLVEYEYRLKVAYLVSDGRTGQRLVRGHTVQVAVDAATGELCLRSPEVLLRMLGMGSV
jgi:acyl-CoA thioester hydrolase